MLANILIYICFSYFATAIANAVLFLTERGQMFGGWQDIIEKVYNKTQSNFLYKALGGCEDCFTMWLSIVIVYPVYTAIGIKYGFYIPKDVPTGLLLWLLMPLLTYDIKTLKNI